MTENRRSIPYGHLRAPGALISLSLSALFFWIAAPDDSDGYAAGLFLGII